jgi:hypothetical protein
MLRKRVEHRRFGIRDQEHVALIDRLETANRRAVEAEPLFERFGRQSVERHRRVLPLPDEIDELEIDHDGASRSAEFDSFLRIHADSSLLLLRLRRRNPALAAARLWPGS